MKKITLLSLLLLGIYSISFTQAQEEIPSVVNTALEHLNEYLFIPIDLEIDDVEWDWQIITLEDFGDGCREREDTSTFLPDVAYDIYFYRLDETYHYRISMDEQLIVPCIEAVAISDDTMPVLDDALADLNRRFHINLSLNDLPWRWQERQFNDYTLGCPNLTPPEETFDQTIEGYVIEFTLLGQQWVYHVSSDRLIVILCNEDSV